MANEQNNQQTNNNDGGSQKEVDPFEKHIDIAIEAQDGKAEEKPNASAAETNTDKGDQQQQGDGKSGEGSDSDGASQSQSAKNEVSEAAKTLAGARDLKVKEGDKEIVVRGGAERRFYEQRETARQQARHFESLYTNANTELEKAKTELNALKQSTESLHGMSADKVAIGARIFRDLQSDPVGTMKKLLAEVTANGYTIEQIGSGVDALAIQRMIDERLPKNNASEPNEETVRAEAEAEATRFFQQYPDAKPHDALIAAVLRDNPGLDLPTAYFQLKNSFTEKGFDWSLSLEDNLKAQSSLNNSAEQQQPNNQQNNNQNQQAPMPSGRGGGSDEEFRPFKTEVAHEDQDTSDIVKEAMREAGMKI